MDLYVCNDVRCEEDNSTYAFNGQGYSDKIEKGDTYNKNIFIQVDDYSRITSIRLTHDYVNSTKADDSFDLLENDKYANTT